MALLPRLITLSQHICSVDDLNHAKYLEIGTVFEKLFVLRMNKPNGQ